MFAESSSLTWFYEQTFRWGLHIDERGLLLGRGNAGKAVRLAILKPQSGKKLEATGMRIVPATFAVGPVPAADSVVVQIQKLRDLNAAFTIIQQQDRIGPTRNTMILALAARASFKLTPF